MSASAEVRIRVREIQNDIRYAEDKDQLIKSFCEAAAFAKTENSSKNNTDLKLPSVSLDAKNIFMRDHYSNFASFMLESLSTDLSSSLTKSEFLKYFANFFLEGGCEDAFLNICGAIYKTSAGLKLNRCIMLLEEFLLQHRLGVILTEQSAINKDNDTSIVLWTADGRTQQWDTLVAEMAALPDKMANKLKTENSSHETTDHSVESAGLPSWHWRRYDNKKKADRTLNRAQVETIRENTGFTLPVGTPICCNCRLKLLTGPDFSVEQTEDCMKHAAEDPVPINLKNAVLKIDSSMWETAQAETETGPPQTKQENSASDCCEDAEVMDTDTDLSQGLVDSSQCSGSYLSPSQASDITDSTFEKLNALLIALGHAPVGKPRQRWSDYSKKTRTVYLNFFEKCNTAIMQLLFHEEVNEVKKEFKEMHCKEQMVSQDLVSETDDVAELLVDSYKKAETWQIQRQVLSVLSVSRTYKEVSNLIPEVTKHRFYAAKAHATTQGCALPPPKKVITRNRMDQQKLDSFLEYITSSHIIKDIPFGQQKLKLSNGTTLETPSVIRCMAPNAIIEQYKQYCRENEIEPLGTSTMFRILSTCSATIRKSLEGLDYFLAEGGRAVDDLVAVVSSLNINDIEIKKYTELLLSSKRYLKTDYKVHVQEASSVPDHCRKFGLSDRACEEFHEKCDHEHDQVCESCEQVQEVIADINCLVLKTDFSNREDEDDIKFRLAQAEKALVNWKNHLLRARNQDTAKTTFFSNMKSDEVLLVLDWAMKFIPRKYREDTSDWFGKRGLSWHIGVAFRKKEEIESLPFVHIFQEQAAQDATLTTAIIMDIVNILLDQYKDIKKVHLWSDNAGCYKSSETISTLFHHCKQVDTYDFCEAQDGKGACDRTAATIKSGIRRYVNQGNDVVTAIQMKKAIESMTSTVKYHVKVADPEMAKYKYASIPAISAYNNIKFEKEGIRVWKYHNIGTGKLIRGDSLDKHEVSTLTVIQESNLPMQFHTVCRKKKIAAISRESQTVSENITCENPGCVDTFGTFQECNDHMLLNDCHLILSEKEKTIDRMMTVYADKLQTVGLRPGVTLDTPACLKENMKLQMGWAIKSERKNTRFNDNQKAYLQETFETGKKGGKKADPVSVSQEMRMTKVDKKRRFSFEELLTPQQVASYFSRISRKNKLEDKDIIDLTKEDLISVLRDEINSSELL